MFLETEQIGLRQIEREDLSQVRDWRNDYRIRKRTREYAPLNMLNQEQWLSSLLNKGNIMFAIVAKPHSFIGVSGLTHIDWRNRAAEWSWYIGNTEYLGKGYARHIAYLLLEYGFGELNMHRIWGEVFDLADDILDKYKRLGFKHEATLRETYFCQGKYWDSWIISILDREWDELRTQYVPRDAG